MNTPLRGVHGCHRCREPDLNWRHLDFQSSALPTELSRRAPDCNTTPDQRHISPFIKYWQSLGRKPSDRQLSGIGCLRIGQYQAQSDFGLTGGVRMNCDPTTLLCEVSIGQIVLVIFLAATGISVSLFGLAEDVQQWWKERTEADN